MPRSRQNNNLREQLLVEGYDAFLHNGYHGTGLKEVLDRLRIPKGSFYNYFESKEAFGVAVIRYYSDCLDQKLTSALKGSPDPLAGLRQFFQRLMTEFERANYTGGCLVANLGAELEGSEVCREALATALLGWRDDICKVLRQAQAQGLVRADMPAETLSDMLINTWEGAVIRMKLERSLAPLQQCLQLLLDDYFQP